MEAVIQKDRELVEFLIEAGADVNVRDTRKWTALHFASQEQDTVLVERLIEAGAEVNATDDFGNSVIARAVISFRGNGDVIRILLAQGADIDTKNDRGISALDTARNISNYDVLQFLD